MRQARVARTEVTSGLMEQGRTLDPLGRPMSRRRFGRVLLGWSVFSTLSIILAPAVGFLIPSRRTATSGGRLLVGAPADIGPGRSKVVALGAKPVIVLNSPQGMKAFSAVCTHLGCIVGYDASKSQDIVSPCHDGHFSALNGTVVSGPPPAPLREYAVTVEQDKLYVQNA